MAALQSDIVDRCHIFLLEKAKGVFCHVYGTFEFRTYLCTSILLYVERKHAETNINFETISLLVVKRKIFLSVSAQRVSNHHILWMA